MKTRSIIIIVLQAILACLPARAVFNQLLESVNSKYNFSGEQFFYQLLALALTLTPLILIAVAMKKGGKTGKVLYIVSAAIMWLVVIAFIFSISVLRDAAIASGNNSEGMNYAGLIVGVAIIALIVLLNVEVITAILTTISAFLYKVEDKNGQNSVYYQ